jgi:hypothetical protein
LVDWRAAVKVDLMECYLVEMMVDMMAMTKVDK